MSHRIILYFDLIEGILCLHCMFSFPHEKKKDLKEILKNVTEIIYQKWDFEIIFTFFFFTSSQFLKFLQ